jgi:hypothetical protein
MEFLDITDSSILLQAIHSPCYRRTVKKPIRYSSLRCSGSVTFWQCCGSGSGIRCPFFDPWIRDRFFTDLGYRISDPKPILPIPGSGMGKKSGSGFREKHTGSATLHYCTDPKMSRIWLDGFRSAGSGSATLSGANWPPGWARARQEVPAPRPLSQHLHINIWTVTSNNPQKQKIKNIKIS